MSLRDDPRYFPQPDVPNNGNYGSSFGREQLYYGYSPRSAAIDTANEAAGEKTYSSGKYTFNPATGQYTWVPAVPVAAKSGAGAGSGLSEVITDGPGGGQDRGGAPSDAPGGGYGIPGATMVDGISGPTTGLASLANSAAARLGNMSSNREPGIVSRALRGISDTLAANVDPSFSHEGRAGRGVGSVDIDGKTVDKTDLGSFAIGPAGLTSINAPTATESQARMDAIASAPASEAVATPAAGQAANQAEAEAQMDAAVAAGAVAPDVAGAEVAGAVAPDVGGAEVAGADVGFDGNGFDGNGFDSAANGGMIGRYAHGGLGSLGGYSDGGRLLRGPGDGVSDSIPATIGKAKRPARLADGEFVVPARLVSELGNGSTEAGARKLYAMLARIQAGRKKSIGKSKVAVNSRMDKHLPA